jgi:hypothetical protein
MGTFSTPRMAERLVHKPAAWSARLAARIDRAQQAAA